MGDERDDNREEGRLCGLRVPALSCRMRSYKVLASGVPFCASCGTAS